MKKFMKICRKEQMELKAWLEKVLKGKYKNVVNGDGFLYAKGNIPVLLTAHMDTVHQTTCTEIKIEKQNGATILSSPQGIGGDDRCGIWMIYKLLKTTSFRPYILFCEDEEIGGVGSSKFVDSPYIDDLKEVKYMIELDRANYDDAVYYDCGNEEFKQYIASITGYKEAWGSFSDISHLSPTVDVASVNLSCGYYKAHTLQEFVVFEEMETTFEVVKLLLDDLVNADWFDYQGYVNNWFCDDDDDVYWNTTTMTNSDTTTIYEFYFIEKGKEDYDHVQAESYYEALGILVEKHPNICVNNIVDYYTYSV